MLDIRRLEPEQRSVCVVTGEFTRCDARDLSAELDVTPAGSSITLDLSRATSLPDLAVGDLAQALRDCVAHVALQGLGRHHQRLLRYLGVKFPEQPSMATWG